jgi:hypothetical protein
MNEFTICRYVVGGRLLNIFTEFYVDSGIHDDHLAPTSPQWIGAWWLGFLLILVLSYICAALISIFPAKMRSSESNQSKQIKPEEEKNNDNKNNDIDKEVISVTEENVLAVSKLNYGSIKEMPAALYRLITNPTYMFISMGATMDAFLLAGK